MHITLRLSGRLKRLLSRREGMPEPKPIEGVVLTDEEPIAVYDVDGAEVEVYPSIYMVREPMLTKADREMLRSLLSHIYYSIDPRMVIGDEAPPSSYLEKLLWRAAEDLGVQKGLASNFPSIFYHVRKDVVGYGAIDVLLKDPHVEEVSFIGVDRPVYVIHRLALKYSRWLPTNIRLSEEEVRKIVQKMVQRGRSHVSAAFPIADMLLPEGHRVAVSYGKEVTPSGFTFTVRKFPQKPLTIVDLVRGGTVPPEIVAYLWLIVEARGFIVIIGPTASGKTTLLNALARLIPSDWKIVTVEDTPEIRIPQPQWDRLVSRKSLSVGGDAPEIGLFELTKFAWRRRPDFLIVGEVRGREAQALVHAVASGHGGMTTFHASSARSAILRLMSPPLSIERAFMMLISSFVTMREVKAGHRVVYRVEELDEDLEPFTVYKYGGGVDVEKIAMLSRSLRTLMDVKGWDEEALIREMDRRAQLVREAAEVGDERVLLGGV